MIREKLLAFLAGVAAALMVLSAGCVTAREPGRQDLALVDAKGDAFVWVKKDGRVFYGEGRTRDAVVKAMIQALATASQKLAAEIQTTIGLRSEVAALKAAQAKRAAESELEKIEKRPGKTEWQVEIEGRVRSLEREMDAAAIQAIGGDMVSVDVIPMTRWGGGCLSIVKHDKKVGARTWLFCGDRMRETTP